MLVLAEAGFIMCYYLLESHCCPEALDYIETSYVLKQENILIPKILQYKKGEREVA